MISRSLGVSAPIVGTTSMANLTDLLGNISGNLCIFPYFHHKSIGAMNVKLTDEEIKELEGYYMPQAAFGHT